MNNNQNSKNNNNKENPDKNNNSKYKNKKNKQRNYTDNNKRKRYNKRKRKPNSSKSKKEIKKKTVYGICNICQKEITDNIYSIVNKKTGEMAHFDCVVDEIKRKNFLKKDENLFYLGSGSFGVVKERKTRKKYIFDIKKRIQYFET